MLSACCWKHRYTWNAGNIIKNVFIWSDTLGAQSQHYHLFAHALMLVCLRACVHEAMLIFSSQLNNMISTNTIFYLETWQDEAIAVTITRYKHDFLRDLPKITPSNLKRQTTCQNVQWTSENRKTKLSVHFTTWIWYQFINCIWDTKLLCCFIGTKALELHKRVIWIAGHSVLLFRLTIICAVYYHLYNIQHPRFIAGLLRAKGVNAE